MVYNISTDRVALLRAATNPQKLLEMPSVDFVLDVLRESGLLNITESLLPPSTNQATTLWLQPLYPSYGGNGQLYAWNGTAYVAATPALLVEYVRNLMAYATTLRAGLVKVGMTLQIDGQGVLDLSTALQASAAAGGVVTNVTRAALPFTSIPAAIVRIQLAGYAQAGDLGAGAPRIRGDANGPDPIADANGFVWVLDTSGKSINAGWFGMVSDGGFSYDNAGATTFTGTDNWSAIQSALDTAMRFNVPEVLLPNGKFRVNDTLHVGYGGSGQLYTLALRGVSRRAGFFGTGNGCILMFPAADRMAINLQGSREGGASGFGIVGPNIGWIVKQRVEPQSISSIASDWFSTALTPVGNAPGGLSRYAPLAAVTVDAYKEAPQANHYPDVTYPAWTGITTQYNKAASSDVTIEELDILGFGVGVCASPNGSGNGDFVRVRNMQINYCAYLVAVCNTQSRNVEIRNINGVGYHTGITNNKFGTQSGVMCGPVENISGGHNYQMFDLLVSFSGPLTLRSLYCENGVRIGRLQGSTFRHPITLESCQLGLDGQNSGHHELPPGLLEISGDVTLTTRDCYYAVGGRIANFMYGAGGGTQVTVDTCTIIGGDYISGAGGSTAYSRALNFTGGLSFTALVDPGSLSLPIARSEGFSNGKGALTSAPYSADIVFMSERLYFNSNREPMHQFATNFVDENGVHWRIDNPEPRFILDMTNVGQVTVAPAWTGDVMTFTYVATSQLAVATKLFPGSIGVHLDTGTLFVVTSVGPASPNHVITCKQMNNMKIDNSGAFVTQRLTDLTLGGTGMLWRNTSIDLPKRVFYGDFQYNSADVTNVHRGDGTGADIATWLSTGDVMYPFDWSDRVIAWPFANFAGVELNMITPANPAAITLSRVSRRRGRYPVYPLPISSGSPGGVEGDISGLYAIENDNGATGSTVLPASQISGAKDATVIMTGALSGNSNLSIDTAANILLWYVDASVGQSWKLRIVNASSANFNWTVTGNTGITLQGTMTIAQNTWRDFCVTYTGAGAVTLKNTGTGTYS